VYNSTIVMGVASLPAVRRPLLPSAVAVLRAIWKVVWLLLKVIASPEGLIVRQQAIKSSLSLFGNAGLIVSLM